MEEQERTQAHTRVAEVPKNKWTACRLLNISDVGVTSIDLRSSA